MTDKRIKYKVSDDVVSASVCGQPVLARTQSRFVRDGVSACVLNETGELIWKMIMKTEGVGMDTLISDVSHCFEMDPSVVSEDIQSFLILLKDQEFIREVS